MIVNPVDSVGNDSGFDTGQSGKTGYAGFRNLFRDRRKKKNGSSGDDGSYNKGGLFDQGQKAYFKNLAELEREKSRLRDWEHDNRTKRDWQTMAEKAHIGDQEMTRFTDTHVKNLMETMGAEKLQSANMATTAGNRLGVTAAKAEKPSAETPVPARPTEPESRVGAMEAGRKEPKERTPSYKEVRAGVAEWRKTKGERGVSPEEGVNLGNPTYNRKEAAKSAYAKEKSSGIGSSAQFSSSGSADAQKEA